MNHVLTIDLGGTQVSYAVTSGAKTKLLHRFPSPRSMKSLRQQISAMLDINRCNRIAVAVPGVTLHQRDVVECPNVRWLDRAQLSCVLEDHTGLPCVITNDMKATGIAEIRFGELRDVRCGILHTISTGWGGCLTMRLGELEVVIPTEPGHTSSRESGQQCGCGRFGCTESEVSGGAVRRRVEQVRQGRVPTNLDPCAYLDQEADNGEEWALRQYEKTATGIGFGWANCLNQNSWIEKIVYCGTFAIQGMRFMRHRIEQVIQNRAMFPHHRRIPIVQSALWPNGVHLGLSVLSEIQSSRECGQVAGYSLEMV